MNQHCSSCFSPWHSHGSGLKRKLAFVFHYYSPAHTKLILAPKLLTTKIITDPIFFIDEARNAFLTQTGYIGLLFTSLNFCQRAFLEMCKFNSYPYTSKCMNQGMFITSGVTFTTCPIKKYRTNVNNLITQSQLRLSGGSTIVRRK